MMLTPEFIKAGPGSRLAFLEKLDPITLAETMVAFANTEGGTIVVGMRDDGKPAGRIENEALDRALKEADSNCNPPVVVGSWEPLETDEGTAYALRVPRSIELHALSDGRVLIRAGARNRPLGGQEILKLASAKSTGDFESEVVVGATKEDFSRKMIDEYLAKRAERTERPYNGKVDDLLRENGAIDAEGRPTVSGIVLFSEYPQHWLPQTSVVFAKFVGKTPRGENGLA